MKIYSAQRYSKWDQLPRFVGQDVWVLCNRFNDGGGYNGTDYVRFLRVEQKWGRDFYVINTISPWLLENPEYRYRLGGQILFKETYCQLDEYDIKPPLEVITTDEILDILRGNNNEEQ